MAVAPRIPPLLVCPTVAKRPGVTSILHLTDLHVRPDTVLDGAAPTAAFAALAARARALAEEHPIDLVLVTGDVLDNPLHRPPRGNDTRAAAARLFLERLCADLGVERPAENLVVIPGNHDYRASGLVPRPRLRADFDAAFGDLAPHRLYPHLNLAIACFDSNPTTGARDFAQGFLDFRAFHRLDDATREHRDAWARAFRLAAIHHHVLPIARAELPPRTALDRLLGRQVVGGADFMLLRNSGTVLHHLLARRFDLVVHGHLHKRGYWRLFGQVGDEEGSLEVISAASSGVPSGDLLSAHLLRIHADRHVTSTHFDFSDTGLAEPRVDLPTAPARRQQIDGRHNLRCDMVTRSWIVRAASGTLETTEVFTALRSADGKPVDSVPMGGRSTAATLRVYDARSLTPGQVVAVAVDGTAVKLCFQPPLADDRTCNCVVTRRVDGAMFRSTADQARFATSRIAPGFDQCTVVPSAAAATFVASLQFDPPQHAPETVQLVVERPDDSTADLDAARRAVRFNQVPRLHEDLGHLVQHRAMLVVEDARPDVRYGFRWTLATGHDPAEPVAVRHLMRRLAEPPALAPDVAARLGELLAGVRGYLRDRNEGLDHLDATLAAVLFAVHADGKRLLPVGHTGGNAAFGDEVGWGHGIVGSAWRELRPVYFSDRHVPRGTVVTTPAPGGLRYVVAFPLQDEGFAVGALALVSANETSGLGRFVDHEPCRPWLEGGVADFWRRLRDDLRR